MIVRAMVLTSVALVVYAVCLFGGAGTLRWAQAWVFILIMLLLRTVLIARLARFSPDLLRERLGSPFQRAQPTWDKVLTALFILSYIAWLILMGLDAVRFTWSHVPIWLEAIGGVVLCASFPFYDRIFRENAYAAAVVKLQKERGHHVITTGPYAIVRHPMYACMLILLPSIPLLLGSVFGLIGAGFVGLLIIVRAALEDRMLQRELDGYAAYAQKVRYRLIPSVW